MIPLSTFAWRPAIPRLRAIATWHFTLPDSRRGVNLCIGIADGRVMSTQS